MAVSKQTWANVLFVVVVATVAALTFQQWSGIGGALGNRTMRTAAFLIPMAFPLGMAWWGKKTAQVGPALGALGMIAILWLSLLLAANE
jgi:hypothetical protein